MPSGHAATRRTCRVERTGSGGRRPLGRDLCMRHRGTESMQGGDYHAASLGVDCGGPVARRCSPACGGDRFPGGLDRGHRRWDRIGGDRHLPPPSGATPRLSRDWRASLKTQPPPKPMGDPLLIQDLILIRIAGVLAQADVLMRTDQFDRRWPDLFRAASICLITCAGRSP